MIELTPGSPADLLHNQIFRAELQYPSPELLSLTQELTMQLRQLMINEQIPEAAFPLLYGRLYDLQQEIHAALQKQPL